MSKEISQKQIAANQANAKKSTGPKTPAGRDASKFNALKHGILSKAVLVRGTNLQESHQEYMELQERFRRELQPLGPLEEMLVDQIVTTHWRLQRVLAAEAGEIALSVDGGQWARSKSVEPQWFGGRMRDDPVSEMERSALGNAVLCSLLRGLRGQVVLAGELTDAMLQELVQRTGGQLNTLTGPIQELLAWLKTNPEKLSAAEWHLWKRERVLAFLDQRVSWFDEGRQECDAREDREEEARQAAAILPSKEVLDRLLRYETTLQRQLFRAMDHLERMQRTRRSGKDGNQPSPPAPGTPMKFTDSQFTHSPVLETPPREVVTNDEPIQNDSGTAGLAESATDDSAKRTHLGNDAAAVDQRDAKPPVHSDPNTEVKPDQPEGENIKPLAESSDHPVQLSE